VKKDEWNVRGNSRWGEGLLPTATVARDTILNVGNEDQISNYLINLVTLGISFENLV